MREADIMLADRAQLADISTLEIEEHRPVKDRIQSYLEQAGNPFLVKVGDYVLKLNYAEDGKDMEDRMLEYVSGMTRIRSQEIPDTDAECEDCECQRMKKRCQDILEMEAERKCQRMKIRCQEIPEMEAERKCQSTKKRCQDTSEMEAERECQRTKKRCQDTSGKEAERECNVSGSRT